MWDAPKIQRALDLPDVALLAVALPEVLDAFAPAVPDRLVLTLVIGPPRTKRSFAQMIVSDQCAPASSNTRETSGHSFDDMQM